MLGEIQAALGAAVTMVITFVPRFIAFLAVFFIGWLVAKAIAKAMDAILERVGFDRLVERGGVKKALARSKYDASSLLSKLVYYVIMLFVLQLSFGVWGANPVSDMIDRVVAYMPNVFAAGVIMIVGAAIAAAVADLTIASFGSLSYGKALSAGVSGAILAISVFAALTQLRIAPAIVVGLFYAILAAAVGIIVVAFGGAGIQPMKAYWQRMLSRMESEAPALSMAARQAPRASRERVEQRAEQAREATSGGQQPGATKPGGQRDDQSGGQPGQPSGPRRSPSPSF